MQLLPAIFTLRLLLVFDAPFLSGANEASHIFENVTQTSEKAQYQLTVKNQLQPQFGENQITVIKDQYQHFLPEGTKLNNLLLRIFQRRQEVNLESRIQKEIQKDGEIEIEDQLNTGVQSNRKVELQNRVNTLKHNNQGVRLKHPPATKVRDEDRLPKNVSDPKIIKIKDPQMVQENLEVTSLHQDFNKLKESEVFQHQAREYQVIQFENQPRTGLRGKNQGMSILDSDTLMPSLWTRMKTDQKYQPERTLAKRNSGSFKPQMSHGITRSVGRTFTNARLALAEKLGKLDDCTGGRLSGTKQAMTGGIGKLGKMASSWGKNGRKTSGLGKVEDRTVPDDARMPSKQDSGVRSPKFYEDHYGKILLFTSDEEPDALTKKPSAANPPSRKDGRSESSPSRKSSMNLDDPSVRSNQIQSDQRANIPPRGANSMFAEANRKKQPGNRDPNDSHTPVHIKQDSGVRSPKAYEGHYGKILLFTSDEEPDALTKKPSAANPPSRKDGRSESSPSRKSSMNLDDPSVRSTQIQSDQRANIPPRGANSMFAEANRKKQPGNRDPNDGHTHVPMRIPIHETSIRSNQISWDQRASLKPGEANSAWAAASGNKPRSSRQH